MRADPDTDEGLLSDSFRETLHVLNLQFKTENLESLKSVRLKMEYRQHLTMTLTGNGNGFDAGEGRLGNGLGNMKNRARRIGGDATIHSVVGEGTTVEYRGTTS